MRYLLIILTAVFFVCLVTVPASAQGQLQIITDVQFTGNTIIPSSELAQISRLKPGGFLTEKGLSDTIVAISQAYRERGYAAVVAGGDLSGIQMTGVLTIPIVEVSVESVCITGLVKTREFAIRRLLCLRPGDLFNTNALRRDADTLNGLGIFDSVNVTVDPSETVGRVVVNWQLAERPKTGYVEFSGSYSPSDKLIGTVSVTQNNFRGRAERLAVSGSIGSISGRISGNISYFTPYIAPRTSLDADIFSAVRYRFTRDLINNDDIDIYYERRTGGTVTIGKALGLCDSLGIGIRAEDVTVRNLPLEDMTTSLTDASGKVLVLPLTYANDRRDSRIYPTSGYLWRANLEPGWSDPDEGGSSVFGKLYGNYQYYRPLDAVVVAPSETLPRKRPRVVSVRAAAGVSAGDLPFFEQYFVGGLGGIRGYYQDRFWGKYMFLTSAEYRQPISEKFTAIGFVDFGDAWGSDFQFLPGVDTDYEQHDGFSPKAGVGVGIRYGGPTGVIGFDVGWGERTQAYLIAGERF